MLRRCTVEKDILVVSYHFRNTYMIAPCCDSLADFSNSYLDYEKSHLEILHLD